MQKIPNLENWNSKNKLAQHNPKNRIRSLSVRLILKFVADEKSKIQILKCFASVFPHRVENSVENLLENSENFSLA
ncbi:MAG: hypothetical protein ACI9JY_000577 [Saprospiraceae bacterium]